MFLNIDHVQHEVLAELVQVRLAELSNELRHCGDCHFEQELKRQKEALERLLTELKSLEFDVCA